MYYNYFPTRNFQIYQIFASNTNLGKTIISAGLIRSSILKSLSINPYNNNINNKSNNNNNSSSSNSNHNNNNNDDYYYKTFYLKPIQTGYPKDSDSRFVKIHISNIPISNDLVKIKTLYKYEKPVSPHLAIDQNPIPNDDDVLNKVKGYISECYNESIKNGGRLFMETAGGVSSPIMSGTIQSEFYRTLRLPTILVGDSNLGGISATLSSYESLLLRGYDIPIIILFKNEIYNNHSFIEKYLDKNQNSSIVTPKIFTIPPPPELDLTDYYRSNDKNFEKVINKLDEWHENRFNRLDEMEKKAKEIVWWPFTQHDKVDRVNVIDSSYKDTTINYNNRNINDSSLNEMFDGSASWWTQGLGHGNSKLTLTASYASGRYGHILFPESISEPSLSLSESLLEGVGKNWANRVFYSDNGSTAMEVAIKMALTEDSKENEKEGKESRESFILGLEGSYHGDTIGAMNACSPNIYNQRVTWYTPKGIWFTPPQILMKDNKYRVNIPTKNEVYGSFNSLSEIFNNDRLKSDTLSKYYKKSIEEQLYSYLKQKDEFKLGALIIEPVVMGAGGMIFVDPLYQRQLIQSVRSIFNVPIIFDEVFTGFWRLGKQSAAKYLNVNPDIAAYAKLLTGGLCPLAVTLSTERIFKKFLGDTKVEALLHGHSYTAHPIGCLVANTSINEYINLKKDDDYKGEEEGYYSVWDKNIIQQISCSPNVNGVFALGTLLSIELNDRNGGGYASNVARIFAEKLSNLERNSIEDFGVKTRPLGNVVYVMSSLVSDRKSIKNIEQKILKCLSI